MTAGREPLFLARQTYRRRRLTDAVRLVPVLGAVLFLIPILSTSAGATSTLSGGIYVFLVWLGLIAATALLSRRLNAGEADGTGAPGEDGE